MAFSADEIKRITIGPALGSGASSVKSVWMLATNDTAADVQTSGYFNSFVAQLQLGDVIIAALDLDGTPAGRMYLVTAKSATAITVAPFQATAIS